MESMNLLLEKVTFKLSSKSKHEMIELRTKLQAELDLVRNLANKIDDSSAAQRAHLPKLSVCTTTDTVEREKEKERENKRTPKANKLYRNSDFLLAKDKLPSSDTNRKTKTHAKKQGLPNSNRNEAEKNTTDLSNKALKNCGALLERLMKHKHGWVFNTPVDPVSLGLRDYLEIIKHPMDLGTVKSRLDTNWYKSPKELAEDVRLTFNNAMTYNPKGQDVHVMAEQLLKMFEEKYICIEYEYMQELRVATKTHEVGLVTPKPKKVPIEKVESFKKSAGSGRTPAPKKPKARDPNKREMTYEEKQKLSSSLQNLPSDKLDDVVKIIKKRNSSLCQSDDEIEVDIDSVDIETLWELDRFVTNYKKMMSKNKRKAELAVQARPEEEAAGSEDHAHVHVQEEIIAPVITRERKEDKADENNISFASPTPVEQQGDNTNKSSSASSSSSAGGSGSSSSGSDSESSSGDGPDAGHSPKKQV